MKVRHPSVSKNIYIKDESTLQQKQHINLR
jgi:hypothetical protein